MAKVLELQPQHHSFQWIFRTDFFRIDWLDLLAVQGTLKSLLQHHSSKPSVLWRSAFFIVQLSHPYMTTGKSIALTRWTFVFKVMSLLFNLLSRLVIAFLSRSKHLLISWRQSPSAVILEPPKRKVLYNYYWFVVSGVPLSEIWNLPPYMEHKERPMKEADHSRFSGCSFNKQGKLHRRLVLGGWKLNKSHIHPPDSLS